MSQKRLNHIVLLNTHKEQLDKICIQKNLCLEMKGELTFLVTFSYVAAYSNFTTVFNVMLQIAVL